MSDTDRKISEETLESLFETARANPPSLSEDAMARILADAAAMQPARPVAGWRGWMRALGGVPAVGGLVTATCVGFWIGMAPPATLPDLGSMILGTQTSALAVSVDSDGFGWEIDEG